MVFYFTIFSVSFSYTFIGDDILKYFRTDGIRGEAYTELTLTLAYLIGLFFRNSEKKVVIGMDTRESSPVIASAIYDGLNGCKDISFAGVIPTPGLMYYTLVNNCIGIMITASHNPYQDNGIKIVDSGRKITKELSEEIEKFIERKNIFTYNNDKKNNLEIDYSVNKLYLEFLKSKMVKNDLKILFDGANGAYSYILKELFKENEIINCNPNGKNINYKCGSTDLSSLIHELKVRDYDIGVAFDGDGDRIMVVDKYNRIYEGDFLTYIFALDLFDNNLLTGKTVVYTEIVNPGIINRLTDLGIYTVITEVGDHNISKALEREYVLGGESSGHIINKTILPFGDGLSNALQLIKILSSSNKKLHEYTYDVKMHYTKTINIYFENNDFDITKKLKDKVTKFANRKNINVILRKSGTEKAIRIFIYQPSSKWMNHNISKVLRMVKNDR